ncbi:hypothetical protein HK099_003995 [Clydaea vesicula]|uniref:Uncharacterized protein n=1 Tax=Clydaea vesicula TaxID=447962 RepID=A0AAD5U464_9FUNG|nr:hypothetical protein HK099_003995 [Clydaea vesicula]
MLLKRKTTKRATSSPSLTTFKQTQTEGVIFETSTSKSQISEKTVTVFQTISSPSSSSTTLPSATPSQTSASSILSSEKTITQTVIATPSLDSSLINQQQGNRSDSFPQNQTVIYTSIILILIFFALGLIFIVFYYKKKNKKNKNLNAQSRNIKGGFSTLNSRFFSGLPGYFNANMRENGSRHARGDMENSLYTQPEPYYTSNEANSGYDFKLSKDAIPAFEKKLSLSPPVVSTPSKVPEANNGHVKSEIEKLFRLSYQTNVTKEELMALVKTLDLQSRSLNGTNAKARNEDSPLTVYLQNLFLDAKNHQALEHSLNKDMGLPSNLKRELLDEIKRIQIELELKLESMESDDEGNDNASLTAATIRKSKFGREGINEEWNISYYLEEPYGTELVPSQVNSSGSSEVKRDLSLPYTNDINVKKSINNSFSAQSVDSGRNISHNSVSGGHNAKYENDNCANHISNDSKPRKNEEYMTSANRYMNSYINENVIS